LTQNAVDGQPKNRRLAGDTTSGRPTDGRRSPTINPVQRPRDVGTNNSGAVRLGDITFQGTSGPVGSDGKPAVFYDGTRDDITTFRTDHPNRKDKGWLGRGIYHGLLLKQRLIGRVGQSALVLQ